jgi:hypothetical protein
MKKDHHHLVIIFNCNCGSTEYYREAGMESLTFSEGHFHCSKCNKEYDYASDEIQLDIRLEAIQLTLF